ncbi:hypothetical protein C8F04DRAFT_997460, partial [Mycena alexandri]
MDTANNILDTNAVPDDADCQRIHELLVGPRKEIIELTDKINGLAPGLTDERNDPTSFIDSELEAHQALVSLACRLPEDLAAEIFTGTLPSNLNATMSSRESPLLLCQICRAWRRLAFSTPRLWVSLH